jgi:hypothetical protein
MANDITRSPLILDATGAVFVSGIKFNVKSIRWVGATTAGHQCILKDAAGRVMWADIASGANYATESRVENIWNGLTVDTLGSGKVYIEV